MGKKALLMAENDNVATLIDKVYKGDRVFIIKKDGTKVKSVISTGAIEKYHKIAVKDIACGDVVRKYGEIIGIALLPIYKGQFVHVHNIGSLKTTQYKSEGK
jgi:hypothetical protein